VPLNLPICNNNNNIQPSTQPIALTQPYQPQPITLNPQPHPIAPNPQPIAPQPYKAQSFPHLSPIVKEKILYIMENGNGVVKQKIRDILHKHSTLRFPHRAFPSSFPSSSIHTVESSSQQASTSMENTSQHEGASMNNLVSSVDSQQRSTSMENTSQHSDNMDIDSIDTDNMDMDSDNMDMDSMNTPMMVTSMLEVTTNNMVTSMVTSSMEEHTVVKNKRKRRAPIRYGEDNEYDGGITTLKKSKKCKKNTTKSKKSLSKTNKTSNSMPSSSSLSSPSLPSSSSLSSPSSSSPSSSIDNLSASLSTTTPKNDFTHVEVLYRIAKKPTNNVNYGFKTNQFYLDGNNYEEILLDREALSLPISVPFELEKEEQIASLILSPKTSIVAYEKIKGGVRTKQISIHMTDFPGKKFDSPFQDEGITLSLHEFYKIYKLNDISKPYIITLKEIEKSKKYKGSPPPSLIYFQKKLDTNLIFRIQGRNFLYPIDVRRQITYKNRLLNSTFGRRFTLYEWDRFVRLSSHFIDTILDYC
jgi:hypothetical protein